MMQSIDLTKYKLLRSLFLLVCVIVSSGCDQIGKLRSYDELESKYSDLQEDYAKLEKKYEQLKLKLERKEANIKSMFD